MPNLKILAVGKVKTPFWQAAIEHYAKRIGHSHNLELCLAKDADANLPMPKRQEQEAERLIKFYSTSDIIICLDEKGKEYTSEEFANFLQNIWDNGKTPTFIIGGAFGLSQNIRDKAQHIIALGKMTMPHELARVVIYEQLYRASTILAGTGYHH